MNPQEQPVQADLALDCLGLYCPMPIVKTVETMKKLAPGEILRVIADDREFITDIRDWCAMTKNECMAIDEIGPEVRAYIRKTG
jgi:tRNA 2-thiouridine synthesizing protein A